MDGLLTLQELETRYSGEWVLLADIESEPGPAFRRGRVLWHSADQDECWAKAAELPASNVGVLYVGDWSAEDEPVPVFCLRVPADSLDSFTHWPAFDPDADWPALAVDSFARDRDNECDAAYDRWREHYAVST